MPGIWHISVNRVSRIQAIEAEHRRSAAGFPLRHALVWALRRSVIGHRYGRGPIHFFGHMRRLAHKAPSAGNTSNAADGSGTAAAEYAAPLSLVKLTPGVRTFT